MAARGERFGRHAAVRRTDVSEDVRLGRYLSRAWADASSNGAALAAVVLAWLAMAAALLLTGVVLLSVVEVLGGPSEAEPVPRTLAEAVSLDATLSHGVYYYLGLELANDLAFSLLLVYPALASLLYAAFAALRRGEQPRRLHFADFFVCFPTSARRSYPLAAGLILFAGRVLFTLLHYVVVDVWAESVSPTAAFTGRIAVWIPYLYYTLVGAAAVVAVAWRRRLRPDADPPPRPSRRCPCSSSRTTWSGPTCRRGGPCRRAPAWCCCTRARSFGTFSCRC
jgi:hypothetical protein